MPDEFSIFQSSPLATSDPIILLFQVPQSHSSRSTPAVMPINLFTLSSLPHVLQHWPENFVYVCLHSVKHSLVASVIMGIPVITKACSLTDTLTPCSTQEDVIKLRVCGEKTPANKCLSL